MSVAKCMHFSLSNFYDLICVLSTSDHVSCGHTRHFQALQLVISYLGGLSNLLNFVEKISIIMMFGGRGFESLTISLTFTYQKHNYRSYFFKLII